MTKIKNKNSKNLKNKKKPKPPKTHWLPPPPTKTPFPSKKLPKTEGVYYLQ